MPDDPGLPDEARRELESRRRDLEREFDGKLRDLKAQHKRLVDSLEQNRAEWEARRKQQAKELADREEKLRRHDDNAKQAVHRTETAQQEVALLKDRIVDLEDAKRKALAATAALEGRAGRAEKDLKAARGVLFWFSVLAVLGTAGWLVIAVQAGDGMSIAGAAVALTASVFLAFQGSRLGRPVS